MAGRHYNLTLTGYLVLAFAVLLQTSCVTVEPPPPAFPSPLRQTTVVSTSAPNFQPQFGETLAWRDSITLHQGETQSAEETGPQVDEIQSYISEVLTQKGYRIVTDPQAADHLMHGLIVLGNDLNEQELRTVLGFEPGLNTGDQNYEKGSLLLIIMDRYTLATNWRAVVQILVAPDMPEDVRHQRRQSAIRSLLRPLPTLKR